MLKLTTDKHEASAASLQQLSFLFFFDSAEVDIVCRICHLILSVYD